MITDLRIQGRSLFWCSTCKRYITSCDSGSAHLSHAVHLIQHQVPDLEPWVQACREYVVEDK